MTLYIDTICEAASVLVSIACYPKLRHTRYRGFACFLPVIAITEMITAHIRILAFHGTYGSAIINTLFFSLFFHSLYTDLIIRKTILTVCLVLTAVFIAGYALAGTMQTGMHFYTLVFTVTGMFFTVAGLGYLYSRITDPACMRLTAEADFWIVAGIVLFYSGISVVFSFYSYIVENNLLWLGEKLYRTIPKLLSILLYAGMCAGMLVAANEKSLTIYRESA
jgi:hypothetical protein